MTDAEQQWLDQEIEKAAQQQAAQRPPQPPLPVHEPSLDDVPAEMAAAAAPPPEPEGGYDDVMAMIEANRKKNEERRAVRRARPPPIPPRIHPHTTITPLGTAAPPATLRRGCQSAPHTSSRRARRQAQSARNAEIIANFEARAQ